MMDQIEQGLQRLGEATEPPASLVAGVMQRIEESAGPEEIAERRRPWGRIGYRAAAIVAAACIAGLAVAAHMLRHPAPRPDVVVRPHNDPAGRPADVSPTFADYQRAMVQSPEALDALLQQRPAQAGAGTPVRADLRAGDVFRSDLNLYQ